MSKTGSEIEKDVFRLIKESPLSSEIKGTVYRSGTRPLNAKSEDAVIGFLTGMDGQVQTGVLNINIYVPNLTVSGTSIKDVNRCEQLEVYGATIVKNFDTREYDFKLDTTPQTFEAQGIEQHFVNIRIRYRRLTN